MKQTALICLLLFLMVPQISLAQGTPAALERLDIDLWPDYDQTAVLVLLTATLPPGTALPATVTLPLPEDADLNAVARIDAADGTMKDDIEFITPSGEVTLTTPDLRFRVEYYLPYSADDMQRVFDFTWTAGLAVNQLNLDVQQPKSASGLLTQPAAANVSTRADGFSYHSLPQRAVPAGEPFSVRVEYTMSSPQLSFERTGPLITDVQTTGFEPAPAADTGPDWLVIVGGAAIVVLIAVGITWRVAGSRSSSKPRKPRPVRVESASAARYCHVCGQPIQPGDKFCRECGTQVKTIK